MIPSQDAMAQDAYHHKLPWQPKSPPEMAFCFFCAGHRRFPLAVDDLADSDDDPSSSGEDQHDQDHVVFQRQHHSVPQPPLQPPHSGSVAPGQQECLVGAQSRRGQQKRQRWSLLEHGTITNALQVRLQSLASLKSARLDYQ